MAFNLSFDKEILFNLNKVGIEVPVWLFSGENAVSFNAKIDTGASFCIFERIHGEMLGLEIEQGTPEVFSTNTGNFQLTVTKLRFRLAKSKYFQRFSFMRKTFSAEMCLGETVG